MTIDTFKNIYSLIDNSETLQINFDSDETYKEFCFDNGEICDDDYCVEIKGFATCDYETDTEGVDYMTREVKSRVNDNVIVEAFYIKDANDELVHLSVGQDNELFKLLVTKIIIE